jgi:D-alanyl-D-alanine carboxypeptidase/D-alanyl-D-alanine-endopeptidase (penicillin-binding protein 4)
MLRHDIDSLVSATEFRNAYWGVLIVDPETGDTLYSRNAGKLFMPASNMKIVTGSVALAQLGPDFRFRTTFVARGRVCDSTLAGDLVVDGRGDPSVSDAMRAGDAMAGLREIADSLAAHGIRRISGYVVPGDTAFSGAALGYGWSWDELSAPYSAGVDALFFNEGFAQIVVHGGTEVGQPVTATVLPATSYPAVELTARTALPDTVSVASAAGLNYRRRPRTADLDVTVNNLTSAIVLSGWIEPGAVDTIAVAYPDQRAAYLAALGEALAQRGITVERQVVPTTSCASVAGTAGVDTLFVVQSPPLRDVLRAMAKPSQNQIAEILLRTVGLERAGAGRADSGAAVVRRQLLAWGAAPDGFVIRDGSGLSRYDYLSPETLVHVLAAIARDTAFATFYDALPIAGVDGTIANRMRGTPAEGNIHAKTGSISNARSLSGYVTTADGRRLIFSLLCNNWTVPARDVLHVQDVIGARLASLTLRSKH